MIESGMVHLGRFFLEQELILLIALVLGAALFDLLSRRIPNWLIGIGLVISLLHQTVSIHGAGLSTWAAGFAVGFVLFLPMYMLHAMGAGDVKLMAMVGSFLGGLAAFKTVLATLVAGGVIALLYALLSGRSKLVFENVRILLANMTMNAMMRKMPVAKVPAASAGSLPYAIAIAAGTLLYIFAFRP
jgi:prepilin peptidase CpaA